MKQRLPIYLIRFLALLPLSVSRFVGTLLGSMMWCLQSSGVMVTLKNIHYCFPELSELERKKLAKKSIKQSCKTFCESGAAWIWPVEKTLNTIKKVHGLDIYQRAIDQGRGVILLAPHLGNWEILGLYLQTVHPIANMYLPPENPHMDALIQKARTRNGVKLVPTNRRGVSSLLKNIKQGKAVGILPDQVPPEESGVFADFYQHPAFTMTLISTLATKTNCAVVCGYAMRVPGGFDIVFREAEPDINNIDTASGARAINKSIENCVDCGLDQYQWEYKRFKKQPDGRTKFYDNLKP